MTGTHAGLCLLDVCSVHTVLFSTPIPFFSLSLSLYIQSHRLSVPLPHPLTPFIPTSYWSLKKQGSPYVRKREEVGRGGCEQKGKKVETKHSGQKQANRERMSRGNNEPGVHTHHPGRRSIHICLNNSSMRENPAFLEAVLQCQVQPLIVK